MSRAGPNAILLGLLMLIVKIDDLPPFLSGLVATYIEVHAVSDNGVEVMFLPYMSKTQVMPAYGRQCAITYTVDRLQGMVGRHAMVIEQAKIIDTMDCN